MSEKATLSILSVESVTPSSPAAADSAVVCVVRCIEGTAQLGMELHRLAPWKGTASPLTLVAIEWYGRQVDQLDTMHSAKVTLIGAGADSLAVWGVLDSAPDASESP
ncbi:MULTISPECIES: hypothetical protein [unclassified Streptomyces]|uniref:hypothetical protein n=1 Tax=unclassified Streptomyces TaxID=2593676 RepID=UPI003864F442|nr:hypothetical protein OG331_35155 [Streptomyces sp. NBC_01017]